MKNHEPKFEYISSDQLINVHEQIENPRNKKKKMTQTN